MQRDREYEMPTVIGNPSTAQYEIPPQASGYTSHTTQLADRQPIIPITDKIGALESIVQKSQAREQQRVQSRYRISQAVWRFTLILGDDLLFVVLLGLVLVLTPQLHLELRVLNYELNTWHLKILWIASALMSWSMAISITRAQELNSLSNRLRSALRILSALAIMLLFWIVISYPLIFISSAIAYFRILLLFLILAAPILSAWRIIFITAINSPRFRCLAVIVGVNSAARTIARELQSQKNPIATVLGFISETTDNEAQENGLPILGTAGMLRHLAKQGGIDMIIIAIDHQANPDLFLEAIEVTQEESISLIPMSIAYERCTGKIPVEYVGDQWYLALPLDKTISIFYLCWCKVLDLTFGICGTLVFLLLLPIIALLIRLDSPGPIFYRQERLGYRGRKFTIYKFRSMISDAEYTGQAIWSTKHDTRITRVGRFMRATHLDELPQVFNILRGDMSFIGPRPEREEFVAQLEQAIPFYHCRLQVKPGLTGWAQVKYHYASSDHDALIKLQYDLYYIKHRSFMLDIFILLKTVLEVLSCRGSSHQAI